MQIRKISNDYGSNSNSVTFKQILRNNIPAKALKDNKYLLIVSGPSGVGKDTLMNVVADYFNKIITCTTRAKRDGEVDGIHYIFKTVEQFEEGIKNNKFAEYVKSFSGKYYGTLKESIKNALKGGKPGLLIVDVDGAKSIRESFKDDSQINVVSIFFKPPSTKDCSQMDVLRSRLSGRGTETPKSIEERLGKAMEEMKRAGEYDAEIAFTTPEEGVGNLKNLLHIGQ